MRRVLGHYGRGPLHLLATLASLTIVGAAVAGWFQPGSDARGIVAWFIGCLLAVELVLNPLAWVLDRIALGPPSRRAKRRPDGAGSAYVRVPAMLSGLLLVVFLPLIFRFSDATFQGYTGIAGSDRYLVRWLIATAVMFACSALLYAMSLARTRRSRPRAERDVNTPRVPNRSRSMAGREPMSPAQRRSGQGVSNPAATDGHRYDDGQRPRRR